MANSLHVDLKVGQLVVLKNGMLVRCRGGFGMASFTMGTALLVEDMQGNTARVDGYDIERAVSEEQQTQLDDTLKAITELKDLATKYQDDIEGQ